jgi:hypothetical protein
MWVVSAFLLLWSLANSSNQVMLPCLYDATKPNACCVQVSSMPTRTRYPSTSALAIWAQPRWTRIAFSMSRSLLSRFVLCFSFIGLLLLLLHLVSLLSTWFLFALLMSCLDASSVPVGVREESRCCHLSVGLIRPKHARSHRNTVSSQRVNMDDLSGSGCVERHVRLLRGPEAME